MTSRATLRIAQRSLQCSDAPLPRRWQLQQCCCLRLERSTGESTPSLKAGPASSSAAGGERLTQACATAEPLVSVWPGRQRAGGSSVKSRAATEMATTNTHTLMRTSDATNGCASQRSVARPLRPGAAPLDAAACFTGGLASSATDDFPSADARCFRTCITNAALGQCKPETARARSSRHAVRPPSCGLAQSIACKGPAALARGL